MGVKAKVLGPVFIVVGVFLWIAGGESFLNGDLVGAALRILAGFGAFAVAQEIRDLGKKDENK